MRFRHRSIAIDLPKEHRLRAHNFASGLTFRGANLRRFIQSFIANPALPAIIVGTVDMIGSRLLFSGYGVSRRLRPTVNFSGHFTYGSGMPLPGFYQRAGEGYVLARDRNHLRAPAYERADVRVNKAYVHQRFDATLYAEVVNVTNHANRDFDSAGPYDPVTRRVVPNFYSMFPILPSVGVVFTFGNPHVHKT